MFTGIVERTATVSSIEERSGGRKISLTIRPREGLPPWDDVELGESVSVNGVCLTAVDAKSHSGGGSVAFEAVPETLAKTTLGDVDVGEDVNVERSQGGGLARGGMGVLPRFRPTPTPLDRDSAARCGTPAPRPRQAAPGRIFPVPAGPAAAPRAWRAFPI